jgi:N-acetylglucosamine-6-sulfatase
MGRSGIGRLLGLGVALLLLVVVGALTSTSGANTGSAAAAGPAARPNIIVIESDDQPRIAFHRDTMPRTFTRLVDHGTRFSQMVATPPLCCPSRAALMTGDYPHNSGVWSNEPGYRDLKGKQDVLPVWLRRVGYRTALVGKFLNGYGAFAGDQPPPGWEHVMRPINPYQYFGTPFWRDGRHVRLPSNGYITDAETYDAVGYLRANLGSNRPIFMWYTPTAPHTGTPTTPDCDHRDPIAKPADYARFAEAALPKSRSYDETDVSDKPLGLQRPPLTGEQKARILQRYRCALGSLWSVDQGVKAIVNELHAAGELRNTLLVYTSDNGMLYGEHRFPNGKEKPYEESTRVPLVVRPPHTADAPPSVSAAPVGMIDLAPTLLDYAGATPCIPSRCRTLDGHSLRPLLEGRPARWRRGRGLLIELNADCAYEGVRTKSAVYVKYRTAPGGTCPGPGVSELYDLSRDPFQLHNLLASQSPSPKTSSLKRSMAARLRHLEECSGTAEGPGTVPCE